jgi:hypothetical protein
MFPRFGNQGSAQAQNLRDSGIPNDKIIVANRDDSYAFTAKEKGFNVEHDFGKAAAAADGGFYAVYFSEIGLMTVSQFCSFSYRIKFSRECSMNRWHHASRTIL